MEFAFLTSFFFAWSITCARRSSYYHGADLANLGRITVAFCAIGVYVLLSGRGLLFPGWPWLLLGGARYELPLSFSGLRAFAGYSRTDYQLGAGYQGFTGLADTWSAGLTIGSVRNSGARRLR